MVGLGASTSNSVVYVVNGFDSRSASISEGPSAHDESPIASTNALPSLSSWTLVTSGPVVSLSSAPSPGKPTSWNQRSFGATRQRAKSSSEPMWTNFSEPFLNSAWTIVAKPLENASSTCSSGSANTPGGVVTGGSTVNGVVNVSNGSCSMCALTRLSPTWQPGPAITATVALPSASSFTVTPLPSVLENGFGTIQTSLPQRLNSWLAVILISDPVPYAAGSHSTWMTSAAVAEAPNSP